MQYILLIKILRPVEKLQEFMFCTVGSSEGCQSLSQSATAADVGHKFYISTPSSWNDALAYCRQHHTDLAVIESSSQNTDVYNSITPKASAWIGLYRVPWTWSDQSLSTFRNWRDASPNNPTAQHCLAENPQHLWDDDYCETMFPVICHTGEL
uniref:C-type lectin domain-containing protein n=1 Tax=Periophthalmus magnuspinnatus TaxID=409849 RepID=A0A3B4B8T1_9GOBI